VEGVCDGQVPQDSLEFVILCAGGRVVRDTVGATLTAEETAAITHCIVDRPVVRGGWRSEYMC
jgi:hypothetical protein